MENVEMAQFYPEPSPRRDATRPSRRIPPGRSLPPDRRRSGRKPPKRATPPGLPKPPPGLKPGIRPPPRIRLPGWAGLVLIGGTLILQGGKRNVLDPAGQGWVPGASCNPTFPEEGAYDWFSCVAVQDLATFGITDYGPNTPWSGVGAFASYSIYEPWAPWIYAPVRHWSWPLPGASTTPWVEEGLIWAPPLGRPLPQIELPVPWWPQQWPESLPLPGTQPLAAPSPTPYRLIPRLPSVDPLTGREVRGPAPQPWIDPNGLPGIDAPGPNIVLTPQPRVETHPRPELPRPPKKHERETSKRKWKSGPIYNAMNRALGMFTEGLDTLGCLQKSIPAKYRAKPVWVPGEDRGPGNPFQRPRKRGVVNWKWTPRGWVNEKGYYRAPTPQEALLKVWENVDKIDVDKLIGCLAAEALEDLFFASLGKASAEGSRRVGRPFGYQTGPTL